MLGDITSTRNPRWRNFLKFGANFGYNPTWLKLRSAIGLLRNGLRSTIGLLSKLAAQRRSTVGL